jgi:membrane-bound lytic murein transglycosylase D
MKRLLLLGFAFIGIVIYSRANALKIDKTFVALHFPIDTAEVKNGFNNLFLASVSGTNGAKLNPRAIDFVQDFMLRNKEDMDEMKSWGRSYFNLIDGVL